MPLLQGLYFAARLQTELRILSNRFQHAKARLTIPILSPPDQTLVDQTVEPFEQSPRQNPWGMAVTDGVNGLPCTSAAEDRQLRKQMPFPLIEQAIAPLNRVAQRLLAHGHVAQRALH